MRYLLPIILAGAALTTACGGDAGEGAAEGARAPYIDYPDASLAEILADATENPYDAHLDSAPDGGCVRIRLRPIGPLRPLFNDSNAVRSCAEYYIDELKHSYPYLVPEAAALLHDIGAAFNDSLAARGGGAYRMKVTSLLRTPATVSRLRRVNRNATAESTHTFGTTFDISYSRFICDSDTLGRTFEDLKNLLGEVLLDFKNQGRCYVKMERRQACFHITARPIAQ